MIETACPLICKEESLLDLVDDVPGSKDSAQDVFHLGSPVLRMGQTPAPLSVLTADSEELQAEIGRLRKQEAKFVPYIPANGRVISAQDRASVIHCIYQIVDACRMGFQTRMLAVNIFDRYIASLSGSCHDSPILLAMACTQLAAKMEENDFQPYYAAPILKAFCKTLDFKQLARTEAIVCKTLDWRMTGPTTAPLLEALIQLLSPQFQQSSVSIEDFHAFAQQLCSAAMQDAYFATAYPSQMALAVLRTALRELDLYGHALEAFVQPATELFCFQDLNTMNRIQEYLKHKIQNSAHCTPQTAQGSSIGKVMATEEALAARRKSSRVSPTSVLHGEESPQSDMDTVSCADNAGSLLDLAAF